MLSIVLQLDVGRVDNEKSGHDCACGPCTADGADPTELDEIAAVPVAFSAASLRPARPWRPRMRKLDC
jgi:hypothetical protein